METGRPDLAEPYFKKLVEIANDARSRFALSAFYVSVDRYADAFKVLERDRARTRSISRRRKSASRCCYYATEQPPSRASGVDEVLAKDARNGQALTVKARCSWRTSKPHDALERVKQAIMVDPRLADAHLTLARVQLALNDVDEARKAFNDTLKLDPNSLPAQLELSELHRNRNEIDTAIQFAEKAIKTNPGNLAARLSLVRALMVRDQDHARAEQELKTCSVRHHGFAARARRARADTLASERPERGPAIVRTRAQARSPVDRSGDRPGRDRPDAQADERGAGAYRRVSCQASGLCRPRWSWRRRSIVRWDSRQKPRRCSTAR